MVKDKIIDMMKRPDCMFGIIGSDGGYWITPLEQGKATPTTLPPDSSKNFAFGSGLLTVQGTATLPLSDSDGFDIPNGAYYGSQFDLRGYDGDLTIVCDYSFEGLPEQQTSRWWIKLYEQGNMFTGYNKDFTIGVYFRKDSATASWSIYYMGGVLDASGSNVSASLSYNIGYVPDGRHTLAFVKDTKNKKAFSYRDGVLQTQKSNTNYGYAFNTTINAYATPWNFMMGGIPQTTYYPTGLQRKIYYIMIFNRVLTQEQINYISN